MSFHLFRKTTTLITRQIQFTVKSICRWRNALLRSVANFTAFREPERQRPGRTAPTQKADVEEHPKVFFHVGLLSNEPPSMAGLLFS
jgi:hypothetical protein